MAGRKLLVSCALCGISGCTMGTVFAQANATALAFISVSLFLIYIVAQRRLGHGASRRTQPIHRVAWFHSEFRRLSGRRARPDGDRIDRATDRQLFASPDVERRADVTFSGRISVTCARADPIAVNGSRRGKDNPHRPKPEQMPPDTADSKGQANQQPV